MQSNPWRQLLDTKYPMKKKTKALKYFTFKQITFPSLHSLFSNESFKTQLDSEVAGCCGAPQRVKLEVVRDCA